MTKVSIIVPVYNVYSYLDKCLNSLINQTLKDIEIIVVNDGTKDESQKIIDHYAKMDKRIRTFKKENGGLGDARNFGIKYALGEYIGFVDADDYIDIMMYEKLYNKACEKQSDIVECDFYWCYGEKAKKDVGNYYSSLENIMTNIRVMVCNKIYKKSIIDKQEITFPVGLRYEDILFTYKILPYVRVVSHVSETLYYYVQRKNSLSNYQTIKVKDIFNILDQLKEYYEEKNIYDKYRDVIEYLNIRYLLGSSFLRILGISDKRTREDILIENWLYLNENYPNWKKNKYLKTSKSLKTLYFKSLNKNTYNISAHLFRLKSR